ncbi:hypothetical protein [Angustibacter sp. Root456]|uniref:hypothetical protein n=1 Tax=Angustibacter sp. Root456 TaxID=1736539 RepID=UPI0006FAF073|nr:hypothetical protein [Angustibacter sp. Root456]KQX65958.1 hypothetical protein ASD06_06045 [Angustibacter sp. Root456]
MSTLHGPTVVRAAVLSAGFTLVLYAVVSVLAPTLLDLAGPDAARALSLVAGIALRVLAGRLAARRTWDDGADAVMVLASVGLGALVGWVVFPGALSVVGVLSGDGVGSGLLRIVVDVLVWLVCVGLGALSARWALPRAVGSPGP